MQTFITSSRSNFGVNNLDTKRLVKQHLENRQILTAISGGSRGWHNHPAVRMWKLDPEGFFKYCWAVRDEMEDRSFAWEKNWLAILDQAAYLNLWSNDVIANWWIDPVTKDKIITTHRASLYRKDPEFYSQWSYEADWVDNHRESAVCCTGTKRVCNYYWPTHEEA